jgi:molecular chaperone GrpE
MAEYLQIGNQMIFKKRKKMSEDKVEQEELDQNIDSVEENTAEKEQEVTEEVVEKTDAEKLAEMNNKYVRLYSDFDNFRKRTIKEKADIISSASSGLMTDLLTVLDDFDRAITNNDKSEDIDGLKEGFKLIHNKFHNILKGKGLEAVDATGEVFDAEIHEAITNIPAPTEADKGKVIDCVEKGYNLRGKSVWYPKVVVGQ